MTIFLTTGASSDIVGRDDETGEVVPGPEFMTGSFDGTC